MARTSTMKGKQNVHYYQISDEGLDVLVNLPKSASTLLVQIIQDADKKDNCCQLSPQQLIAKYELNHSNAYTQIRKLKSVGFLKEVKDVSDTARLMVNPIWVVWQSRGLVRFTILMYSLGSHDLTVEHLDLEDKCRGRIDVYTGEHFDWFRSGLEHADQHYGLKPNTRYEYVSTDLIATTIPSQKALLTQLTNLIDTNILENTNTLSEESTDFDDYDDYSDSCRYRKSIPVRVSLI